MNLNKEIDVKGAFASLFNEAVRISSSLMKKIKFRHKESVVAPQSNYHSYSSPHPSEQTQKNSTGIALELASGTFANIVQNNALQNYQPANFGHISGYITPSIMATGSYDFNKPTEPHIFKDGVHYYWDSAQGKYVRFPY